MLLSPIWLSHMSHPASLQGFFFFLKRPPKPSTLNVFLPAPPHSSALISVKTVSRCSANHLLGRGVSIPVYSKNQDASLLDLFRSSQNKWQGCLMYASSEKDTLRH